MASHGTKDLGVCTRIRFIGNELLNAFAKDLIPKTADPGWQAATRQQVKDGRSFGAEDLDLYQTEDFEVAYNEVSWGGKEGIDPLNARRGRIHHNYIHDILVYPSFSGGKTGIYVDAWGADQYGIEVDHNFVERAGIGISFFNEGKTAYRDMSCHHNVLVGNYWGGIAVGANEESTGACRNIRVENNTLWRNGYLETNKGMGGGIRIPSPAKYLAETSIRHNIVADSRDYAIAVHGQKDSVGTKISIIDNLIQPLASRSDPGQFDRFVPTYGDRPRTGDPGFVDPANYNFRLRRRRRPWIARTRTPRATIPTGPGAISARLRAGSVWPRSRAPKNRSSWTVMPPTGRGSNRRPCREHPPSRRRSGSAGTRPDSSA